MIATTQQPNRKLNLQYKISIPEPCHQHWDNMLPDDTGRYCNNCQKSVIDFTEKTDEEIQQFIINNFNQPLCGRFKNTQIHRIVIDLPQNIFTIKMPLWMRFLVACLLIFSISIFPFQTTIAGKSPTKISFYQDDSTAIKSADVKPQPKKRKKKNNKLVCIPIMMGMFNLEPPPNILIDSQPRNDTGFKVPQQVSYAIVKDESTHLTADGKSLPHKEQPRPTPFIPIEFILPSILLLRKENSAESMD